MSISAEVVTVGTSATALEALDSAGLVLLRNASGDIYLGGSDVDTTDGWLYGAADDPIAVPVEGGSTLYAIAASSQTVKVLRTA